MKKNPVPWNLLLQKLFPSSMIATSIQAGLEARKWRSFPSLPSGHRAFLHYACAWRSPQTEMKELRAGSRVTTRIEDEGDNLDSV